MKTYRIDQPKSDSGCFVSMIKYLVLFIVTTIGSYLFLSIVTAKGRLRNSLLSEFIGDHIGQIAAIIALLVLAFYVYKVFNQLRYGSPFEIVFQENGQVKITCINPIDGVVWEMEIPETEISGKIKKVRSLLLNEKRMLEIYQKEKLKTVIDLDLTAWHRNEHLDELIEKLTNPNTR